MKQHFLKTVNPYFQSVYMGTKTFEYRLNDRNFEIGDMVILQEYDNITGIYSGRVVYVKITYVLSDYCDMMEGYVIFSFVVISSFKSVMFNLQEK